MLIRVVSGNISVSSGESSHRKEEIIKWKVDTTEEPGSGKCSVISESALTIIYAGPILVWQCSCGHIGIIKKQSPTKMF
jgi:hypothetical protein